MVAENDAQHVVVGFLLRTIMFNAPSQHAPPRCSLCFFLPVQKVQHYLRVALRYLSCSVPDICLLSVIRYSMPKSPLFEKGTRGNRKKGVQTHEGEQALVFCVPILSILALSFPIAFRTSHLQT